MQTGWGRVAGSVYKNCSMGASSVRAIIYRVSISTGISPFSYLDMVERLFPMSPAMSSRVIFRFFRHSGVLINQKRDELAGIFPVFQLFYHGILGKSIIERKKWIFSIDRRNGAVCTGNLLLIQLPYDPRDQRASGHRDEEGNRKTGG